MFRGRLGIVNENWKEIVEVADEMADLVYQNNYEKGAELVLVINTDGQVLIKLENKINSKLEFEIIRLEVEGYIKNEKERFRAIEYLQDHDIIEMLTKFHKDLVDKATSEQ